jgi:hypothetical protein
MQTRASLYRGFLRSQGFAIGPGAFWGRDEIRLESFSLGAKAQIVFGVPNLRHAFDDLRNRRLPAQEGKDSLSLEDPDGTVIIFVVRMQQ